MASSCARLFVGKYRLLHPVYRVFNSTCTASPASIIVANNSHQRILTLTPAKLFVACRSYSKGKEKGEKSIYKIKLNLKIDIQSFIIFCLYGCDLEKKTAVVIDEREVAELINITQLKEDLQKSLDKLKADYVKNLTIRSAAGFLYTLDYLLIFP